MDNINNNINENYNNLYVRKKEYIDTYYKYKTNININNADNYNLYNNVSKTNKVLNNFNNLCNIIKKTINDKDNSIWNDYETYSSDNSKLSCKNIFKQNERKKFIVDIKKKAKQQINISNKLNSNELSFKDFKISIKYKDIETTFDIKTLDKTNYEVFNDLDAKINKSNLDVYSEITNIDDTVSISIFSNKTGENENFDITGSKEFIDTSNLDKVYQKSSNSLFTIINEDDMNTAMKVCTTNNINIDGYDIIGNIKDEGTVTIENKINKKSIIGNVKQFVESYNLHLMHCKDNNDSNNNYINIEHLEASNISINCLSTIGIYKDSYGFLHIDEVELSSKIDNNPDYVKTVICGKSSFMSTLNAKLNSNISNNTLYNSINDSTKNTEYCENNLTIADNYYSFYKNKLIGIYNRFGQYGMINSSIIGILVNMVA